MGTGKLPGKPGEIEVTLPWYGSHSGGSLASHPAKNSDTPGRYGQQDYLRLDVPLT